MKQSWHPLASEEFDGVVDYYLVHAGVEVARRLAEAVVKAVILTLEHP